MQTLKFGFILAIACAVLIVFTSQKPKTTVKPQQSINDSTAILSVSDAKEFIKILDNVPHGQYVTLDPKQAITEFVNWKLQALSKKALPDSTNKKK